MVAVILKVVGLLIISKEEILAYTFIFYGISSVYLFMGKNKKFRLFLGTMAFLIGIVFFIINNFEIISLTRIIFPSVILIPGIGCLILYIDHTDDKIILWASLILILIGLVYSVSFGTMKLGFFMDSIYKIILKYWIIVIITIIIILGFNSNASNEV
jgi:hypothetical protein